MFNTMTITKTAGALIGSLLFLLLVLWLASGLFSISPGAHGDEEHAQAYTIPVEGAEGGAAEAVEEGPSFEEIFANADAAAGERAFGKCRACHKLDGTDGTGPHLNGVVNRDKASVEGFNYSQAAIDLPGVWTPENLNEFITSPRTYMPGTRMAFAGINRAQERADLIKYLESQQ